MFVSSVFAATPPLSDDQAARLHGAVDGGDYHDEAFLALVENVRTWTSELGDAPIRLNPNFDTMLRNPSEYRGELCRLRGVLQQETKLPPPFENVTEWFVRPENGESVIVYIVGLPRTEQYKDFDPVEIDGRFYKRMEFTARDGKKRGYPSLVSAFPRRTSASGSTSAATSPVPAIGGIIVLLGIAFVAMLLWAKRSRGGRRDRLGVHEHRATRAGDLAAVDGNEPLPDDPAQALAELKRRADIDAHRQS